MAKDIYQWIMSAKSHEDSIRVFRQEVIESHTNQTPFPISLIFDLLPLQTNHAKDAIARGSFKINQDEFSNHVNDDLWMEFFDPVIEEYYVTIPASLEGTIKIKDDIVTIIFNVPLELEIPRISRLGIDRSAYQVLTSIQVSSVATISKFADVNDSDKETWILAEFGVTQKTNLALFDLHFVDDKTEHSGERLVNPLLSLVDNENRSGCGPDPDDPGWYVHKRRSDNLCIVHYGTMIYGGSISYIIVYGPNTRTNCQDWVNINCDNASSC